MKRFNLLLLIAIYFISATGLSELSKLPLLQLHYQQSKHSIPELTFGEFLVMHYLTDDNNSKDDAQDRNLPYKSIEACFLVSAATIATGTTDVVIKSTYYFEKSIPFYSTTFVSSSYQNMVWHPPKSFSC